LSKVSVVSMLVDVSNISKVIAKIERFIVQKQSAYVCVSNVHMCMEVEDNKDGFADVVNDADIVIPDGRPIYWAQKLLGHKEAEQVRGMDITYALCEKAEAQGLRVGFYGASEETLGLLRANLLTQFPKLDIAYIHSPPFRELAADEKQAVITDINDSGVQILFVGLGCPKQERWMAEHKPHLKCVMLGVGAAFDFLAGNKKHAPIVLQKFGLEWLFRLISEPKRLWKRYLTTNPRFIVYFLLQLMGKKF